MRARRIQNVESCTPPVVSFSSSNSDVIRYPETTKKTSTPKNPPYIQPNPAW